MSKKTNQTEYIWEYYLIKIIAGILRIVLSRFGVYLIHTLIVLIVYTIILMNTSILNNSKSIVELALFTCFIILISSELFYQKHKKELDIDRLQFKEDINEASEKIKRIKEKRRLDYEFHQNR
jgi:hypothetical protein